MRQHKGSDSEGKELLDELSSESDDLEDFSQYIKVEKFRKYLN